MSEKDPTLPAASPEDASSPSSPSPEQWLEPLLARIAQGIEGNTASVFEIRKMVALALAEVAGSSDRRVDQFLADLQLAFDKLVTRIEDLTSAQKTLSASTGDAQKALEAGEQALATGAKALDDGAKAFGKAIEESGRHLALIVGQGELAEEGAAPSWAHRWNRKLLNFMWPLAVRRGPEALKWAFKLSIGSTALAALGKLIHFIYQAASR